MKRPVIVPRFVTPCRCACSCKRGPMDMAYKTAALTWRVARGERVGKGEILCEAEVEKAVFEIPSPADGRLADICAGDGAACGADEIIGYVEDAPQEEA